MKRFPAILLIIVAVCGTSAFARSSTMSPLLGSWAVDISRLPMPPAARPRSVTINFSDAGAGKWTTQVDIVGASGASNHSVSTTDLDGKAASVDGLPVMQTHYFKRVEK